MAKTNLASTRDQGSSCLKIYSIFLLIYSWYSDLRSPSGLQTLKKGRPVAHGADIHTQTIDLGGGRTDREPEISNTEPPATAASTFLPWSMTISISVFIGIGRRGKKNSVS